MNLFEFSKKFGIPLSTKYKSFAQLGDYTSAKIDEDGVCFRRDYGRGLFLNGLVAHYKPRKILEIGTGRGYSGISMLAAQRKYTKEGTFITIDIRDPDLIFKNIVFPTGWKGKTSVRQLFKRFLKTNDDYELINGTSRTIVSSFENSFDFVYIDGAHGFYDVIADLEAVTKYAIHDKTIIVIHDYGCPKARDVKPAVDSYLTQSLQNYQTIVVETDGDFTADCTTYIPNGRPGSLLLLPR